MFSIAVKVQRGFCVGCKKSKEEVGELYVLDVTETTIKSNPQSFELSLKVADCDNACCARCWSFIGRFISNHTRVTVHG